MLLLATGEGKLFAIVWNPLSLEKIIRNDSYGVVYSGKAVPQATWSFPVSARLSSLGRTLDFI